MAKGVAWPPLAPPSGWPDELLVEWDERVGLKLEGVPTVTRAAVERAEADATRELAPKVEAYRAAEASRRPQLFLGDDDRWAFPFKGSSGRVFALRGGAFPSPARERLGGIVDVLVPPTAWARDAEVGALPLREYRKRHETLLRSQRRDLVPGVLAARGPRNRPVPLGDGDSLICSCSLERAAGGWCHRTWVAGVLADLGWDVVCDGAVVAGGGHA